MTLKEIKSVYSLIKSFTNNQYLIYDKCDYIGYLTKEKSSFYFNGLPTDDPILVRDIDDLKDAIKQFIQKCKDNWIRPDAYSPLFNKEYSAQMALSTFINKMGFKPVRTYSDVYSIAIDAFNTSAATIKCTKNVINVYFGEWSTSSPEFTDYIEALSWIKAIVSKIMLIVGTEFITSVSTNNLMNESMTETTMNAVKFSNNGISCVEASLNDYLIELLEHQIELLKTK